MNFWKSQIDQNSKDILFKKKLEALIETIEGYAVFVDVKSTTSYCRDEKGKFLISLSVDSDADFLLAGGQDLLILNPHGKQKSKTISSFMNEDFLVILNK